MLPARFHFCASEAIVVVGNRAVSRRTKGLQLVVFLVLSALLIRPLGLLGAAIAVVASDLLIQFGL